MMGDRLLAGKLYHYFHKSPRRTQPPTSAGLEMSTCQSAVILSSWGEKAPLWFIVFIPLVDKRACGLQVKLCDPSLTRTNGAWAP